MYTKFEITGRSRSHIQQCDLPRFAAQKEVVQAFLEMRNEASKDHIELVPFSSFRDYETQLRIWNGKFSGKKPLYDIEGKIRDFRSLNESQIIECILNWSALPGGSRHQWGTEIDVVDGLAMPDGYKPKLLPEETSENGIFYQLHQWLDKNIKKFGFFRPYKFYKGGMYPEPWHLSYAPLSLNAIKHVTVDLLVEITREADILGKELVIEMIPQIFEKHILNIVGPDEQ